MLTAIYFGDYKRVKSRVKREREEFTAKVVNPGSNSCDNCNGNCAK